MNWSGKIDECPMRVGILGGTFDPPHIGHQILAAEGLKQMGLDHVLWVLTPYPPHKKQQKITQIDDRLRMVEKAIEDNPDFRLSKVDMDRQPPHYAVDTMLILKNQSPEDEFYYLMGLDSLNDLLSWHHPVDFVKLCHGLVVMYRQGELLNTDGLEKEISGLNKKLHFLETPIIDISASEIRKRVETGRHYRYFVPDKVYRFILKNQLYRN